MMKNLKWNWLVISKLMWEIWRILTPVRWSLKNVNLIMGSFWAKCIFFEWKKYRGVFFGEIEEWRKIWEKTDLWFGKWEEEFGKFLPEHSKVSKLELWWDPFIQNRKCMSLQYTEELCIITIKNDAKLGEELICCFKTDIGNLIGWFWDFHWLKNSNINLESKSVELNQNKNSKQPDRLDAVCKLYFTLEINE